jgi:hypothetical protein
MINIIVTVIGVLMVISGFYLMYLGFSVPPNPLAFFLGLISSVLGLVLIILFGSRIGHTIDTKPARQRPIARSKEPKKPKIPAAVVKSKKSSEESKKTKPKPISRPTIKPVKPKPKSDVTESKPEIKFGPQIKAKTPSDNDKGSVKEIEKLKPPKSTVATSQKPPEFKTKPDIMVHKEPDDKISEVADDKPEPKKDEVKRARTPIKPTMQKPNSKEADGDKYVKNRLERLKKNYFQNTKDIENIIDERLDSFKGTLNRLKSESKEPSIIWSFEAHDVQGAMKDTISKAEKKILIMYPWVRNIDVSILKKFMETDSRMIIQEASLDDDASVELIRLLLENQVKIRTMPHVHTVALVSDDDDGLIISTDPIYESYEVGVIYKDKKSIKEIENMFEDAWSISKELDMEIQE